MAGKEVAVKKYVVRLSAEERERLGLDPQRQGRGATADEGADLIEGRCVGSRRRLERRPDREALDTSVANVEPDAQADWWRKGSRRC